MSDLSNIVDKATDAIVNGQALSTDNLNDLAKIFYASANRIIEAIDKSAGLHREIVPQLPTQDIDDNIIYMVLDASATGSDVYDEWMWIENAWEHIGSTRVDLSGYYTKTEVDTGLSGKADTSAIPTLLSQLTADATHRLVTDTEKSAWNGKSNFSGSYNDLSNKPTIPSKLSDLTDDVTHRVVTDAEKTAWNEKAGPFSTQIFYNNSAFTVNANSYKNFTTDVTRQGYTPISVNRISAGGFSKLVIAGYYLQWGELFVRFFNPTSSDLTLSSRDLELHVLYSKD